MCIVTGMDRGGFHSYLERGMPSKRVSTVRVEYVTVFCTLRLSLFPILAFDIMLPTLVTVDAFKL